MGYLSPNRKLQTNLVAMGASSSIVLEQPPSEDNKDAVLFEKAPLFGNLRSRQDTDDTEQIGGSFDECVEPDEAPPPTTPHRRRAVGRFRIRCHARTHSFDSDHVFFFPNVPETDNVAEEPEGPPPPLFRLNLTIVP